MRTCDSIGKKTTQFRVSQMLDRSSRCGASRTDPLGVYTLLGSFCRRSLALACWAEVSKASGGLSHRRLRGEM